MFASKKKVQELEKRLAGLEARVEMFEYKVAETLITISTAQNNMAALAKEKKKSTKKTTEK